MEQEFSQIRRSIDIDGKSVGIDTSNRQVGLTSDRQVILERDSMVVDGEALVTDDESVSSAANTRCENDALGL
jgi:hypothetical protein